MVSIRGMMSKAGIIIKIGKTYLLNLGENEMLGHYEYAVPDWDSYACKSENREM